MENAFLPPNPLLDPILPAIRSRALVTGANLGLFEALAGGPLDTAALGRALDCDAVGIQRLAELLVTLGYLERREEGYTLSAISRTSYVPAGQMPLTDWVHFCETQLRALGHLDQSIRSGRPVDLFDLMGDGEALLIHQRAMAQTALPAAEWVAAQVPVLEGAKRMLDVGGSHGVYSAAICRRHPPLEAEVLELPATMKTAVQVAREHDCHRFVSHRPGDILSTPLEGCYALCFLGNLVHHLDEENLALVLKKLAAHTTPGGGLAIWDMVVGERPADTTAAGFGLFFYLTSGAGCHSATALKAAVESVGFSDVAVTCPPQGTTHILMTARKG